MPYSRLPHGVVIAISLFFAFFLNLWGVPLFDLDEGAFAEATREILASGNFAATYLDGRPRFDKPILSYWFQAVSVSIFGLNEWALRLPTAIASSLWLLATYRFVKQFWDEQSALITVMIMANTLWIGMIGRAAIADGWLNLFIALAMFDIHRYFHRPERGVILRTFLWLGLGVLTKGPVAVLIPLLTAGVFFVLRQRTRQLLSALLHPLGWAVLALTVLPWAYLVYRDQGADFFYGFIVEHNLHRFSSTREGHGGSLFYYFLVLPLILLPFSGGLLVLLRNVKTLWQDSRNQFLLLWFAVVFVLVSFSQTQLPHYVLYGATGLLILLSTQRALLFRQQWHFVLPALFFALMIGLPFLVEIAATQSHRAYEKEMLSLGTSVFDAWYYALSLLVASVVLAIYLRFKQHVWQSLIAIGAIQTLFVFNLLIDKVADIQQQPVKQAALFARQHHLDDVVAYGINMPSFSVYREQITPKREPAPDDVIFTRADRLDKLSSIYQPASIDILYERGGILLVRLEHE